MAAKKRILIGEDEPSVMKMTKLRLEHEGYDVVAAMDGEAVLNAADGTLPIHLILLDVKMPKLSGFDVCRTLKGSPSTAKIPVIVFTASESQWQALIDRCIEIGATDWLKKPFQTRELMTKIHQALGEEEQTHG